MTPTPEPEVFPVDEAEPAIRSAGLRELVDRARAQPQPALKVEASELVRVWSRRRLRQRIELAAAFAAAGVLAWSVAAWVGRGEVTTEASASRAHEQAIAEMIEPEAVRDARVVAPAVEVRSEPARAWRGVALPPGVDVEPLDPESVLTVLDDDHLEITVGRHFVQVAADRASALTIHVGERVLLVEPNTRLELDGTTARFTLVEGQAHWNEGPKGLPEDPGPGASALARRADTLMRRGQRARAIAVLERLVELHPRSSAARTGLIDLARLHRAEGSPERAYCAYALYLERWPDVSLRAEVERNMTKLGVRPACP